MLGNRGCKSVVVPPPSDLPHPHESNKVSQIGSRGVYSLAEIIGIGFAKNYCAISNKEKKMIRKELSRGL
jgi:hypothetical protein